MPGSIQISDSNGNLAAFAQGSGARAAAPAIGVAQSDYLGFVQMIQRYLPSTTCTSNTAAGSSVSVTVGSTANMFAGQLCLVDSTGTNPEWAEVQSVTSATVVVFAKLLSAHTGTFTIVPHSVDMAKWCPGAPGVAQVSSDGQKATYRAAGTGLTFYSTAAAVLVEIQGSATKTVRIKKIDIWGQAGTKFFTELQLLRSTGLSGSGTPVAANIGKHDLLNDPTATAVINSYAAAATYGAGHLLIGAKPLSLTPPAAAASGPFMTSWDFCRSADKALIVRGTGDVIQVYNTITGLGTATFGFEVEWEEDAS